MKSRLPYFGISKIKIKKLNPTIIAMLILIFSVSICNAETRVASKSGNWTDTKTWGKDPIPTASDNVIITKRAIVTININNAVCASLQLGSHEPKKGDGTLFFENSTSQLTVGNDVVLGNDINETGSINMINGGILKIGGSLSTPYIGTFIPGSGTIEFNGTTTQTINTSVPITFNNLTIDNEIGVVLANNYLTLVTGILTINAGKKFEIAPGKLLEIIGSINNNAGTEGFTLQSDATGTAALIHNTSNVPATVELYINGAAETWHFLSSPVSNQSISNSWTPSGTYGNGSGYDLYLWNEPTFCWFYQLDITSDTNWNTVHPSNDFMVGRGYLYSVQAPNPTNEFVGNLNNESINYGLTINSPDLSLKGFNLVGNPYPSSIDWQSESGWTRSNLVNSGGGHDIWIWNPAAKNYGVCNSYTGITTNGISRYIAPMQGFFVQAEYSDELSMNNDIRVLDESSAWFKSEKQEESNMSICVKSDANYGSDEILLDFGCYENGDGAKKLFSSISTAPSLYINDEGNYYSVRHLTNTNENSTIPIMFAAGIDGNYTISCNFDPNSMDTVMLQDKKTEYIQNMNAINTYQFHASTNDDKDRFVLHFGSIKNDSDNELQAGIYSDGISLVIDLTQVDKETEFFVYDLLGRLILQEKLQGGIKHNINLNAHFQILIISLKNTDRLLNQKIYWGLN
jgi:hypothetical protein